MIHVILVEIVLFIWFSLAGSHDGYRIVQVFCCLVGVVWRDRLGFPAGKAVFG